MPLACRQRDRKTVIRHELVERVKAEIAAGEYETPERLEIAINRLTEELLGEPERLSRPSAGSPATALSGCPSP